MLNNSTPLRSRILCRKILIGKENSLRSHALTHAARTGIQTHGTGVRSVDHAQQRHRTTHHCPLTRGAPTGAPCATPRRPQSRPQLTSARRFCATQRSSVASRSYCASRAQAALQAAQEPSNVRHKVVAADAIGELRPEARVRAVVHARHVAKTRHRRQQAIDAPFLLRRDDLDKRRSSAVTESSFYARFCPRGLGIP